ERNQVAGLRRSAIGPVGTVGIVDTIGIRAVREEAAQRRPGNVLLEVDHLTGGGIEHVEEAALLASRDHFATSKAVDLRRIAKIEVGMLVARREAEVPDVVGRA